jgi:hypothetical protein
MGIFRCNFPSGRALIPASGLSFPDFAAQIGGMVIVLGNGVKDNILALPTGRDWGHAGDGSSSLPCPLSNLHAVPMLADSLSSRPLTGKSSGEAQESTDLVQWTRTPAAAGNSISIGGFKTKSSLATGTHKIKPPPMESLL